MDGVVKGEDDRASAGGRDVAAESGHNTLSKKMTRVKVRVKNGLMRKKFAARLPTELKEKWQHSELLSDAVKDIDASESYDKLCTIDKDAEGYME